MRRWFPFLVPPNHTRTQEDTLAWACSVHQSESALYSLLKWSIELK
jgi:hypothetical protein